MKIQIIGLGIVGTAQAYLSQTFHKYEIFGYDINIHNHPYCKVNNEITDADITFICTPEDVVEDVVKSLYDIGHKGLIVIKSTTPIGTIQYLSERFKIHICHNPEFLREETYLSDVKNPDAIIIGQCCEEHGNLLEQFYKPIKKPIIKVDIATSELIKLATNAYLSTLITFWNEIDELCNKLNIDTKRVSNIIAHDPRISNYGCDFFGQPYGGKCLPKDISHLITAFHIHGLNPKLFEACENFNKHLEKQKKKDN